MDVVPMQPGEDPDTVVARLYGGDPRLADEDLSKAPPLASDEAFSEWRAAVIERLREVWPWQHEYEEDTDYFWTSSYGWQIEVNRQDVTLRSRRRATDPDVGPSDDAVLGVFRGLNCVLVYPNADEWVAIDGPNGPVEL